MVKKFAGKVASKASNAAGKAAKTATKEAAGAIKRNVIDEATKPLKEAAKKKVFRK